MIDLLNEVNANLGTDFKSNKELKMYSDVASKRLVKRWIDSDRTDYGIYKDPDYIFDAISCYSIFSKICVERADRFYRYYGIPKGKTLDIYNGCGLNTVLAAMKGFDVVAMNDNPAQVQFMNKSALRHLGRKIPVITSLAGSYDAVFSFEVIEHFSEPMPHIEDTLSVLKPGGYLIESTGFRDPLLLGHFDKYVVDGETVDNRRAATLVRKRLEKDLVKVMVGFNKKPRIWKYERGPKKTNEEFGFSGLIHQMNAAGLEP